MPAHALELESGYHGMRRWATAAHRHRADDHIGAPAVLGQGMRSFDKRDGPAEGAVDAAEPIAGH